MDAFAERYFPVEGQTFLSRSGTWVCELDGPVDVSGVDRRIFYLRFKLTTISRSREYSADEGSAKYNGTPYELISALGKLDTYSKRIPMEARPPRRTYSSSSHLPANGS
jgi:hypothetical protein